MIEDLTSKISEALGALAGETSLREGARGLLNALGYESARTLDVGTVEEFLKNFRPERPLTSKQHRLFDDWRDIDILFQLTDEEINRRDLFGGESLDRGRVKSFLFLAVEMRPDAYSRTHLAEATRAVNRFFKMPVIVFFRHGSTLTLAAIHRRAHNRDDNRDVLEKVTLVKDIHLVNPHRAHIEILADLAMEKMSRADILSFDDLHKKWEQTLNIEVLNKRFYEALFGWFDRAVQECRFPDDGAGYGCIQRSIIRLITRLLFIWFLKEKGLVPPDLFEEGFAFEQVKNHTPENTNYYRAVLQNLFFATLNTEIKKRQFSRKNSTTHRDFNKYRYRNLLQNPEGYVQILKTVPFVNGGLFDCLDDFASRSAGGKRIDAFTDNIDQGRDLHVPARLLLDEEDGIFALFHDYKFTVEENTPLDTEIALDPELLGRVFENLLAAYNPETRQTARRATGSYYTPRPVVDYMVREALTEALATNARPTSTQEEHWRDQIGYLLDWEDENADAGEFFDATEARSVVEAIAELKTLDPAVGSGAFPMGVLQTLTLALRRLDPDNLFWESFQKKRAVTRAGRAFDTANPQQRNEELTKISATFEKYRHSDFGRKLYLIQNGIYGVDIQPIACQIAKLRFFISLIIEQDHDFDIEPNFGIEPLPNMETRMLAADSLLRLEKSAQLELGQTEDVRKLESDLTLNRERYFLAQSRSAKLKIQENDKCLRNQLAEKLQQTGFSADAAECTASWDPYDQNEKADWFDAERMFGISDGFDIIIGNPPYIQLQQDGGRARKRYQNENWETFQSTGDIYQLFFEHGCKLLKPQNGVLTYITSNSYLKAEYGKSLRRWFAEHHTPLQLIEMGKDVFENAIVDTAVLMVRSGKDSPVSCVAVDVEQAAKRQFPPPKRNWGTLKPEGDKPWMALSSVERSIMEKMEAVGTPLRDWDISIYYGIKTGYNDAFIIDTALRDRLISEDPSSAALLKPILRGRDIARYRANWAGLWLIDTHNGYAGVPPVDIASYPAVRAHLDKFFQRLEQRQDKGITPYNLRNCAYHENFVEEKLFWMDLTPEGRFSYSPAGAEMYCANSAYFMHGPKMKWLAAFLNSSLITWYVKKTVVTSGMGTARWIAMTVEKIPVPYVIRNSSKLEQMIKDLLVAMGKNEMEKFQELESAVEHLVLESYGITENQWCELQGIETC